jgi:hypothetical protein
MKILAAAIPLAFLATGCMVRLPGVRSSSSGLSAQKRCPPGHGWSDGSCNDKGKGHDPAKHSR